MTNNNDTIANGNQENEGSSQQQIAVTALVNSSPTASPQRPQDPPEKSSTAEAASSTDPAPAENKQGETSDQQQQQLVNPNKDEYEKMEFNNNGEDEEEDDDGKQTGKEDVVLVPQDPDLSSPSIPGTGTTELEANQMNRRKRLFAAKSVLLENPSNQKRRKRPAHKSVHPKTPRVLSEQDRKIELERLGHSPVAKRSSSKKKGGDDDNNNNTKSSAEKKEKPPKIDPLTGKPKPFQSLGPKPVEVYRGPPDDKLEGGWPDGWIKTVQERQSGTCKGNKDRYWHSPGNRKLRSMVEVRKFLKALALPEVDGNEAAAWKVFKKIQL